MIHSPSFLTIQAAGALVLLELVPYKSRAFAVFVSKVSSNDSSVIDADGLRPVAASVRTCES